MKLTIIELQYHTMLFKTGIFLITRSHGSVRVL